MKIEDDELTPEELAYDLYHDASGREVVTYDTVTFGRIGRGLSAGAVWLGT